MSSDGHQQLGRAIAEITEIAKGFGLDFYPMRYEICPADIIYTFGAYGMPTRFSHWTFGKSYHKMRLQYDLGLSKIYELVINSDPCYAFLLEGNSLIQNKLIVAHVLAHCDFFKNNARYRNTNRQMVESMAASAERMYRYEMKYGKQKVEHFLDAVLSIQEHIDPSLTFTRFRWHPDDRFLEQEERPRSVSPYDDLWYVNKQRESNAKPKESVSFPPHPEKDILLFIEEFAPSLEPWQRDVMTIVREEMLYFWPQLETKIMNEGWATYWHQRILRELDLSEEETVEYAKLHAGVIQPARTYINPYHLGLKIFEDIERRWNDPTAEEQEKYGRTPGMGREKIFEVRELDSDISFIRNYLTKEMAEELDLYTFAQQGNDWRITNKRWERVRDALVVQRVNGGFPYIVVSDGDYGRNGELLLTHHYEGVELDVKYIEKTLPFVLQLWGKNVHLRTILEGRDVQFTYDGKKCTRKFI